jgi:hypothetical protein
MSRITEIRGRGTRLAAVTVMAGALLVACTGSTATGSSSTPSPTAAQSATPSGAAAVGAVIQLANQEQQQAFAQDKPTIMRPTATAAYYAQLVALDSELRSAGVIALQLRSATPAQVTIQGRAAQATTTETWQATLTNASTTTSTTVNDYSLVLIGSQWKIGSDTQPRTNIPPSSTSPGASPSAGSTPGGVPATVGSTSRNWSGYVATGATFTAVRGTWTVPAVSATGTAVDATWVGIGGATTTDLIQAGTQATVENGVVQYASWVETLPQASQTVPLTVSSGDAITVSITQQSAGVWNIMIQDGTSGGSYAGTINYSSSLSSAEWIEEAPTLGNRVQLLDHFGTVQFSNLSTVDNQKTATPAAAGATPVTMANSPGVTLATPSALGAGGASFSVTRD